MNAMVPAVLAAWFLIGGIVWLVFLCFLACSKSSTRPTAHAARSHSSFRFLSKMTVFLITQSILLFSPKIREKYGLSVHQGKH